MDGTPEAEKTFEAMPVKRQVARGSLSQLCLSPLPLWNMVGWLCLGICLCYAFNFYNPPSPFLVLFAFPASWSLAAVMGVALAWRVGSTAKGWMELWTWCFRWGSLGLFCSATLFISDITQTLGFKAALEQWYLITVFFPLVIFLLHTLPVYALVVVLQRRGYEIVHDEAMELPREGVRWQFHIRDLMIATLVASLLLAPLAYMDLNSLASALGIFASWRMLAHAAGKFVIVYFLAKIFSDTSIEWSGRVGSAVTTMIFISILESAIAWPLQGFCLVCFGLIFLNAIYVGMLLRAWAHLEGYGWRIVLEGPQWQRK